MSDDNIKNFYAEICNSMEGEYKIILEPGRKLTNEWIEYDRVKWIMDQSIENLVKELKKQKTISFEEKILRVYEHICLNYIYDANVLFFFKKDMTDPNNVKYIAVDWYGRIVGQQWIENRRKHNRRICYEFARFYAKAINELLDENSNLEACMVGDKDNLHYVVGITGDDYSAILDLDDFSSIKDLTRLKMGLTIKGIKILRDDSSKLTNAVAKFNENRLEENNKITEAKTNFISGKSNIIKYFIEVLEILKSYNIDSQGIFEYMRAIIENENIKIEKIWKEEKVSPEKRYARCFSFEIDNKVFIMDSVDKSLMEVSKNYIDNNFISNQIENEYNYYGG